MNLRTTRDSVQIEANETVLVETSGLDEALKVCLLPNATSYAPILLTLVQEMTDEKESFMAQYESIAEQTAVIDQVQKPLLQELNEVKKKVEEFDGQRQEAQVCACPPCLYFLIHLSLASRVELRRPLNSG
jgi:septal ring factor EnvC (AmiA/AmiB activator)